jgi:hypothetical protein
MRFLFLLLPWSLSAQMAVAVDRMNVVYPGGIANPLTVVVSTVPDSHLALIPSVGRIERTEPGKYAWRICTHDTLAAQLILRDISADTTIEVARFRVKKLPIPVPVLGHRKSVNQTDFPRGEFCRSGGLALLFQNFDFDARCEVVYYDVLRAPQNEYAYQYRNTGARFNAEVQAMVNRAVPGDVYYFFHIAYRCGCDPMVRYLSDEMRFEIK